MKLMPGYSWNAHLFCSRTFACYECVYCKLYAVMIALRESIIDFCVHYVCANMILLANQFSTAGIECVTRANIRLDATFPGIVVRF